jgi:hypothetical protein
MPGERFDHRHGPGRFDRRAFPVIRSPRPTRSRSSTPRDDCAAISTGSRIKSFDSFAQVTVS